MARQRIASEPGTNLQIGEKPLIARKRDDGFLRDPIEIANRLAKTWNDTPEVNAKCEQATWDTVTELAWRPAWSIRSRRGCLTPILAWWREKRSRIKKQA